MKQPDILYIMTDQQRFGCLGFNGHSLCAPNGAALQARIAPANGSV